jgi:hypothetical protein
MQPGRQIRSHRPASVKNIKINQCAPGCGLERPGEGAVARQPRGKFNNSLNRTICAVEIQENTTIKSRTTGFGLKRLGDGVAASVLQGMVVNFSAGGGG